jgi:ADP-ribosylglycohydrolase
MPSITYAHYLDRVLGAWLGAVAGATIGSAHAARKDFADTRFDKKLLAKLIPGAATDLAVLHVHALRERGPHLTSKALAEEREQHFRSEAAEFGIARRNWRLGVPPPASGRHNNEFFGESVGAAARAFIWGLVCPGAAKSAVRYARRDAELDHYGDGVEAAMFLAAFVASSFFESDIETLAHTSLHQVEGGTRFARVVRDVLRWTADRDFESCRALIRSRHATPDYSRALVNVGFCLAGLLQSKGDFEASVLGVAGCGYDAARNAALVGAVCGVLTGAAKLPDKWKKPLGGECTLSDAIKDLPGKAAFPALSEETCRLGMELGSVFDTRVEFQQVPSQITVLEHNPMYVKVVDVFVEYAGAPTLRFGDERSVRLKIVSRNPRRMTGALRLKTGKELEARPDAVPLDLGPYETKTIEVKFAFSKSASRLPMSNPVAATFAAGKEPIHSESFGLCSAAQWLALGPFWENSKSKLAPEYTQEPGFDVKWLAEPDVDEKTKPKSGRFFERVIVHADGDIIPLDNVFPPTGPCTLYLVARVHSPVERKAMVCLGSNDAVKLWVNRKPVIESDARQFFTPFNHIAPVKLNKGVNRLLLKVARSDRFFAVRFALKDHDKAGSLDSPWLTDLSFERFEG